MYQKTPTTIKKSAPVIRSGTGMGGFPALLRCGAAVRFALIAFSVPCLAANSGIPHFKMGVPQSQMRTDSAGIPIAPKKVRVDLTTKPIAPVKMRVDSTKLPIAPNKTHLDSTKLSAGPEKKQDVPDKTPVVPKKKPVAARSVQQEKIFKLKAAIASHPDSSIRYLLFAEAYRNEGDLKSAIPTLKGGLLYLPFAAGLRKVLAEAYSDNKEYSKAIEQYQWFLQLCEADDRKAVRDTLANLVSEAANEALHVSAVDSSPKLSQKAAAGNPAEAPKKKKVAEKALAVVKADMVKKKADSINTAAVKTVEFRIDSLLSLVAIDTLSSAGHQMLLGIHEFLVEQYDNALREFKHGAALYPAAPVGAQCLYNTGICYCRLHLFPEALNQFSQMLSRFPGDTLAGRAFFLKAFSYAQMKDPASAEKLSREFLVTYPHHPWIVRAWIMLGDFSLQSNRPGPAIDAYQQALSAKGGCPDRALTWIKMGDACRGVGNAARTMTCYDSAITIGEKSEPDCLALALYKLGDERYKAKNYSGALDCYSRAVYRFPGSDETPWGIFQMGNVHRNLHNYNEAINNYKDLIKRFPTNYWASQAQWELDDAKWESEYLAKK